MANKKILEKKQTVIDEIKNKVNDSSSFVLFDYRGLTDAEIKELRCALRNADANYKVYKNTLMARAFNDLNIDLSSSLEGPSAFAYSKDQVAPIKVLSDFAKDHEALVLKVGVVDGEIADTEKLKEYENILNEKDENNELKNARMKDIDVSDKNRIELIKFLKKFYDEYNIKSSPKGLYLHGSFGSGKTFLLACLLNELEIKKHISYEIVYYPELLRTLKEDLSLVESKVSYYSNVEILVLDDIGAENVTNWGRDEILGTILQERMNKHKTTFFTSNLDINELEKHLSCSKDNVDNVKARRIIERIKQLTIDMPLISVNRRN